MQRQKKLIEKIGHKTSLALLAIVVIGVAIATPFLLGFFAINATASVPIGLWFICSQSSEIEIDSYVLIKPQNFANYINYKNRQLPRNNSGQIRKFIKQVKGQGGDLVESKTDGIYINGILIPDSKILNKDKKGEILTPFPLPYKLKKNEIWLSSNNPRGFDSRYLGPANIVDCRKLKPLITRKKEVI